MTDALAGLRALLSSGALQSPSGAFCAWREAESGELAFEYPEITGYALTHLAGRPDPTGEERTAARRAGGWLVERLERGDLAARAGWDGHAVYNFDLAMIATGLLTAARGEGHASWEGAGRELVADLVHQHREAGVLPALRARARAPSTRSAWSTEGFAHLVKAVQCLLADGGEEGRAVAGEIAARAADVQRDDGRFVTHPRDAETMLHPHLYAVEGLWMYAEATGSEDARERARDGAAWAMRHVLDTGGLPRWVVPDRGEVGPEQFDLTAQGLRMAVLLDVAPAERARVAARLEEVAVPVPGAGVALPYRPGPGSVHLNAWTSMFGYQALRVAREGAGALAWAHLV